MGKQVTRLTLVEAFELYRLNVIVFKNQSAKTEEHHIVTMRSLLKFLDNDIPLESLTFETVREWKSSLERKGRAPNTVRGYIIRLRCVLAFAEGEGIQCLKVRSVPVPQVSKKRAPGFLREDEMQKLIDVALASRERSRGLRAAAIVALIYSSGIRVSEIVHLNINDIHYETFVASGKGAKDRPCFVDERARKLIDLYLKTRTDNKEALFLSNQTKERISVGTVQGIYRRLRRQANITHVHVTPHIGRHSFATNFLRNNGNLRHLQVMMGHESIETTQVYTHVVDEDLHNIWKKHHSITEPQI